MARLGQGTPEKQHKGTPKKQQNATLKPEKGTPKKQEKKPKSKWTEVIRKRSKAMAMFRVLEKLELTGGEDGTANELQTKLEQILKAAESGFVAAAEQKAKESCCRRLLLQMHQECTPDELQARLEEILRAAEMLVAAGGEQKAKES